MIHLLQPKIFQSITDDINSVKLRISNHLTGPLSQKVFFVHLHKCGGTSVAKAVRTCYRTLDLRQEKNLVSINASASLDAAMMHNPFEKNVKNDYYSDPQIIHQVLTYREELLLYYMCNDAVKYVSGHFGFSSTIHKYFSGQYAFITLMRDPVDRIISLYYYNRYHSNAKCGFSDLKSYLKLRGEQNRGYYVRMLGGLAADRDYTSRDAIARAKQNLHKFALIGCLEYLEDFIQRFECQFHQKLRVRKLNQSPRPLNIREETENMRTEIEKICSADIEIYNYVRKNFVHA